MYCHEIEDDGGQGFGAFEYIFLIVLDVVGTFGLPIKQRRVYDDFILLRQV